MSNRLSYGEIWRKRHGLCIECGRWIDPARSATRCPSCVDARLARVQEKRYMQDMMDELGEKAAELNSKWYFINGISCPERCRKCQYVSHVSTGKWFCILPECAKEERYEFETLEWGDLPEMNVEQVR